MAFDISPYLSGGRHVVTFVAGTAAGIGVASVGGVSNGDLVVSFNHIFNGLGEIMTGLGPIIAASMGIWATIKGRMSSKVADVQAASPKEVINAMSKATPAILLDAAANVQGVTKINATPELAKATESPKIVS